MRAFVLACNDDISVMRPAFRTHTHTGLTIADVRDDRGYVIRFEDLELVRDIGSGCSSTVKLARHKVRVCVSVLIGLWWGERGCCL